VTCKQQEQLHGLVCYAESTTVPVLKQLVQPLR
jgi:hypothetical protein